MNKRRSLLIALAAATFAPRPAFAQLKQTPFLIGWLHSDSREASLHYLTAFKEGLAELGLKERVHYVMEERWANGRSARLQSLAEDLAAKKPAVIVAAPLQPVPIATKAAPTTPIVQATGGDPSTTGLVKSLARPGGMVTGLTNFNAPVTEKFLELLIVAAPGLNRVAFLMDPNAGGYRDSMDAARRSVAQSSVQAQFAEVVNAEDIDRAIPRLAKDGAQALVVMLSPMLRVERRRIMKLATAQRWPVVAGTSEFVDEGALLSYSADVLANYRRAAYYVDKILKGAKPGDLPIEQSTKFELAVNVKTAKALGITIPQSILLRADKLIE